MGRVTITLISDGTAANAASINPALTALRDEINGNLDDNNVDAISGTKITSETLPNTALTQAARRGWYTGVLPAPNTITNNGQRSYSLVFNSTDLTDDICEGTKLRITRTAPAQDQCTYLDGATQYFKKTSPNKMTFTDDFVCDAYVKIDAYGSIMTILSRYNGTSGFAFRIYDDGRVLLIGYNAGAANYSQVVSRQSIPTGKWVRVTAQLDMSAYTATTTTSYIMIDGIDVPAIVSRAGTNPTALVQAGDLEIGSDNAGSNPFDGKIAQAAFFTNKVTQATMRTYHSQTFTGTETNLGSAYSFDNDITDLNTTTPNDLSVGGGSATADNSDSPYGQGLGLTYEYGIVTSISYSTNTTMTVFCPENSSIPTSGGVTAVDFANIQSPYLFPNKVDKWTLKSIFRINMSSGATSAGTAYNVGDASMYVPTGNFNLGFDGTLYAEESGTDIGHVNCLLSGSAASSTPLDSSLVTQSRIASNGATTIKLTTNVDASSYYNFSTLTKVYMNIRTVAALNNTAWESTSSNGNTLLMFAVPAYFR